MIKQTDTKEAVRNRFPEAVALIITKSKEGIVNLCPIGYFCMASPSPRTWAIGIHKEWQTNKNISETSEFVLCIPSMDQIDDLLFCGSVHGTEIDKTKKLKLKFHKSEHIHPPVIEDAVACFECKVTKSLPVNDHTFFFGEVLASYVSDKTWKDRIYNWDDVRLGTLTLGNKFKEIGYSPQGKNKK